MTREDYFREYDILVADLMGGNYKDSTDEYCKRMGELNQRYERQRIDRGDWPRPGMLPPPKLDKTGENGYSKDN